MASSNDWNCRLKLCHCPVMIKSHTMLTYSSVNIYLRGLTAVAQYGLNLSHGLVTPKCSILGIASDCLLPWKIVFLWRGCQIYSHYMYLLVLKSDDSAAEYNLAA